MSLENLRSQIVELLNKELKQLNNGSRQVVNDFVVPDPDALIDGYNSSYNPRNAASQHIFESLLERYPSKYKQKLNKYFHILFVIDVFQYLGLLDDASITSDFSFELPKYLQESEVQPTRSEPQSLADHKEKLSKIRRHDVHQQSFINDLPSFLASTSVKIKRECSKLAQQYKIPTNSVEFFDYQTSKLYDILWDLLYKKGLVDVDKKLGDIIHIEEALDKSGFKITFHEGFVNGQKTKNLAKELLLLSYLLPALEVHNPDVNKFRRGGTLSQSYKEHRQSEKGFVNIQDFRVLHHNLCVKIKESFKRKREPIVIQAPEDPVSFSDGEGSRLLEKKQVEPQNYIEQLQQELVEVQSRLAELEHEKRQLEEAQTSSDAANIEKDKELVAMRRRLEEQERQLKQAQTSGAAANPAQEEELKATRSRLVQLERQLKQAQTSSDAANIEKDEELVAMRSRFSEFAQQLNRQSEELAEKQTELESLRRTTSPLHNGRTRFSPLEFVAGSRFDHSGHESDSDHTLPAFHTAYNYSDDGNSGRFEDMSSSEDDRVPRHEELRSTMRFPESYRRRYVDESQLFERQTRLRRSRPSDQQDGGRQDLEKERFRLELDKREFYFQQELAATLAGVKAEHEKALRRLEANSESKSAEALQKLKEASDAEKRSSAEDKRMLEQAQKELAGRLAEAEKNNRELESKSAGEMGKLSEGHKAEQEKIKQEFAAKITEQEKKVRQLGDDYLKSSDEAKASHEKALRGLEEKFAKDLAEAKAAATPSTPTRSSTAPSPSTTRPGSPTGVADFDSDKEALLRNTIPSEMKRLNKSSNNQAFDDFISLCKKDGADGNESFQVIFNTIQANKSAYIDFANKLLTRLALMSDAEVKKAFQLIKQFSDKDQKHDMCCQLFDHLSVRADYDNIIKQNRAAFIEFAKLSVNMKDTTDALESFNAIDDQKIQESISKKIGSHSDLFAINDRQAPAYQSIRQQSSIESGDQVPLLRHKDGYQPNYYDTTTTSLEGGIALGTLVAAGTIPAFFLGALASGAAISLPIAFFVVGAIGSAGYAKLHNDKENEKYNKEGNPVNYQSQISSTDIVR